MDKAVYAGSFDPVTEGHLWVIRRAARLFDAVVVAIGTNVAKTPEFSQPERVSFLEDATRDLANVTVAVLGNEYLAHFAQRIGATHLIRGIRSTDDFASEKVLAGMNRQIAPTLETVFLSPTKEVENLSSSLVKTLCGYAGKGRFAGPRRWREVVKGMVPTSVFRALKLRVLRSHWEAILPNREELFGTILNAYQEPTRVYHGPDHILDLLELCDELGTGPIERLAAYFHDFADERRDPNGVEKSAAFAERAGASAASPVPCPYCRRAMTDDLQFEMQTNAVAEAYAVKCGWCSATGPLAVGVGDEGKMRALLAWNGWRSEDYRINFAEVAALCRGTDHRREGSAVTEEQKRFADMDLAILGADPEAYSEYATAIRAEYRHISDENFASRRAAFLRATLNKGNIYHTRHFIAHYQSMAIENMTRELEHIEGH